MPLAELFAMGRLWMHRLVETAEGRSVGEQMRHVLAVHTDGMVVDAAGYSNLGEPQRPNGVYAPGGVRLENEGVETNIVGPGRLIEPDGTEKLSIADMQYDAVTNRYVSMPHTIQPGNATRRPTDGRWNRAYVLDEPDVRWWRTACRAGIVSAEVSIEHELEHGGYDRKRKVNRI